MPTRLSNEYPTLLIRREAWERAGLSRARLDESLGLTEDEFLVDGNLIVVGPLVEPAVVPDLIAALEQAGLSYFDDFFEASGNLPGWLTLIALETPAQGIA